MWKAINLAPSGYEPVYSIIDTQTGRDIATDLEKDEALKIEKVFELADVCVECREMLEELYLHSNSEDQEFLKSVNNMIIKIDYLKKDMELL